MALGYLISPVIQVEDVNGKPLVGGRIRVYRHGTTIPYITYKNWYGDLNPAEVILDAKGMCILIAEDDYLYDVYCEDRNHVEQWSRLNVGVCDGGGAGGISSEMQHWLGKEGPVYTSFPGDSAGHVLGISTEDVEYVGDFIDRISECTYPDASTPDGYIYLKPGLYYISCIIRYQQDPSVLSNTLDEVVVYTEPNNSSESIAYQMDSSGPETTDNIHNVRVSFIRKVPDTSTSEVVYFAPSTPIPWKDVSVQKLEIVRLDGIRGPRGEQGPQGEQGPAGPAGEIPFTIPFVAGHGITMEIDSDGGEPKVVISADDSTDYSAGTGIKIDSDNVISGDYRGGYGIEISGNTIKKTHHRMMATNAITYSYCKVFDFTWQYVYGRGLCVFTATHYGGDWVTYAVSLTRALGANYTIAWPYVVSASPYMAKNGFVERLEIREVGNRIVGYLKLRNFNQSQFWLDWEGSSDAGYVSFTPQLTNSPEGDIAWTCSVDKYDVFYSQYDADNTFQKKLTEGDGILIDSDGVISVDPASVPAGPTGATGPDGLSAYEIWLNEGHSGSVQDFLDSLVGPKGETGAQGPVGPTGATGETGEKGDTGATGPDGLSAYELWINEGHSGTVEDFLDSLVGPQGETGVQGEQGLKGETGEQGPVGPTGADGKDGADGEQGPVGPTGATGASAYEIWLAEGHSGSEADFLASLVGPKGETGAQGPVGPTGADGKDGADGEQGPVGPTGATGADGHDGATGADGKSAYEIWIDEGHSGSEADFLASLVGPQGATGATGPDGLSAYEIWINEGHSGSEQDFLDSLVGPKGETGAQGEQGIQGIQGIQGPTGPQGIQGIQGPVGPTGPTGTWGGTVDQTYDATSANPQSGTAVAEAVATKEDEFDAGEGLEFITDSDGNRVLQVEGPVDVVAGPGIVIDNPDGNTLRISQAYPTDRTVLWEGSEAMSGNPTLLLSESCKNFEYIVMYGHAYSTWGEVEFIRINPTANPNSNETSMCISNLGSGGAAIRFNQCQLSWAALTSIVVTSAEQFSIASSGVSVGTAASTFTKVVGIHRIANN